MNSAKRSWLLVPVLITEYTMPSSDSAQIAVEVLTCLNCSTGSLKNFEAQP